MIVSTTMTGRILLVDDDPAVLRAYARVLIRAGFVVQTASDGKSGLKLFRAAEFDLVVSDIDMPNMDGLELLRALRGLDPDIPVILMTGSPTFERSIQSLELGAVHFLLKPVMPNKFLEVVSSVAGPAPRKQEDRRQ